MALHLLYVDKEPGTATVQLYVYGSESDPIDRAAAVAKLAQAWTTAGPSMTAHNDAKPVRAAVTAAVKATVDHKSPRQVDLDLVQVGT